MEDVAGLSTVFFVMNKGKTKLSAPGRSFPQSERLISMGLGVLRSHIYFMSLKNRGFPVKDGIYTLGGAAVTK